MVRIRLYHRRTDGLEGGFGDKYADIRGDCNQRSFGRGTDNQE